MIRFFKSQPGEFLIVKRNGKIKTKGRGISCYYTAFNTTFQLVPVLSHGLPYSLVLNTADHQEVHLHGALDIRITDPELAAEMLDFTYDAAKKVYRGEGLADTQDRISGVLQSYARPIIKERSLEEAMADADGILAELKSSIQNDQGISAIGVTIESVHLYKLSPTAEMQQALEAELREAINQRSDQAIYVRRQAAQTQEANLKRDELDAQIEMESQREHLVEKQAENNLTLAKAEAEADRLKLDPYASLPGQALVGLAQRQFAEHPQSIGQLNLTPDVLSGLAGWMLSQQGKEAN